MKRGLLIAGGTLGGLGAVMAITPPQLGSSGSLSIAGGTAIGVPATTTTPAAVVSASTSATKQATAKAVATKKVTASKSATATKSATGTNSNSNSNAASATTAPAPAATTAPAPAATTAPTPAATTAPAPAKSVSGTFVGPSVFVQYGDVQVQITVVNGRITDASALVAPSGKNDRYTNMAVPILRKQTLAAQSDAIQGASGASYTSYGWYKSLQGALAKAGL